MSAHPTHESQDPLSQRRPVALYGASGRMGSRVMRLLSDHGRLSCRYALKREDFMDRRSALETLGECHALIDFSTSSAQDALFDLLDQTSSRLPLISGVTGLSDAQRTRLNQYAHRAPVFYAPNFSLGVTLLKRFTQEASRLLGESFDVEVFELHHRQKIDAPSGTALHLAEVAARGRSGEVISDHSMERDARQVHVSAGRGGQVIGDHTVYFLGEAERIELSHRALNRDLFALGALRATEWVIGRAPGLYSMDDLWD